MNIDKMKNKVRNTKLCIFCKGTGIAKYVDMFDVTIPFGTHNLSDLKNTHGKFSECPEGCRILNQKNINQNQKPTRNEQNENRRDSK